MVIYGGACTWSDQTRLHKPLIGILFAIHMWYTSLQTILSMQYIHLEPTSQNLVWILQSLVHTACSVSFATTYCADN